MDPEVILGCEACVMLDLSLQKCRGLQTHDERALSPHERASVPGKS